MISLPRRVYRVGNIPEAECRRRGFLFFILAWLQDGAERRCMQPYPRYASPFDREIFLHAHITLGLLYDKQTTTDEQKCLLERC